MSLRSTWGRESPSSPEGFPESIKTDETTFAFLHSEKRRGNVYSIKYLSDLAAKMKVFTELIR